MNEPLSEVIRIRVTPSHAARLGEAAALSGLSLSNYIRRRLSADDTLQEELTLLRQIVADLGHLRDTRLAAVESAQAFTPKWKCSRVGRMDSGILRITACGSWRSAGGMV